MTEETKPNTIKANNTGIKWQKTHKSKPISTAHMCTHITVHNCRTQYRNKTVLITFPLILQTISTAEMSSSGVEGGHGSQNSFTMQCMMSAACQKPTSFVDGFQQNSSLWQTYTGTQQIYRQHSVTSVKQNVHPLHRLNTQNRHS